VRFAVVVVAWNGQPWIDACLASIESQEEPSHVVVVDNGSTDGTVAAVERRRAELEGRGARLEVLRLDTNMGFSFGANRGLEIVLADFLDVEAVLLLNQDAALEPGCLAAFADALGRHSRAGALGAKILYPDDGRIQHAGGYLEKPRMTGLHHGHHEPEREGEFDEEREVEFVTGAAMMLRTAAVAEVGVFDEVFSPGYYEDVDLCDRLRASKWPVLFVPAARVIHRESSSFADRDLRLRTAHRNRFIYALPRFSDTAFGKDFLTAERAHLEHDATFDDIRAVSGAALEVLARLPALVHLRVPDRDRTKGVCATVRQVLTEVRGICNRALRAR
jgi:GT2 family glycosyltransferase